MAGLKGEELIIRGTEDGKTALNFQWDYPGRENDNHHPRIGFMMDSEDGRLEEKLALWDAVLNAMRPAGR
ncbi:T6SS immunity protein Tli4 family protein [Desulfatitalea sp. M08but]|uniref:T6SS immunity protein Tli4 family protein n=1 Tax=Desulfatitalea alkaliphila TaxID=2929485 RepID=A0AA41USA6_9BACT|nr:T6SS immunity protein Tli4 family protein [Desulfatitalea alkaliphila]